MRLQIRSQLAVIGGGPAGVCAALSAARQGIHTVLVCDRPVLGGNSSSEFRVWTRGAVGAGSLFAEEMGIWGELKLINLYRNPDANPVFWDEVLLDAVLKQKNLKVLLNTTVFQVETENNQVCRLRGIQSGTEKEMELVPDFLIDATGDGSIAEKAGMEYSVGTSEGTLGSSILYYSRKENHPVKFIAPDYAYGMEEIESLVDRGGRVVSEKMSGCDCWWFEYGGTRDTIHDEQEITIELKRLVLGVWNYIKNSGKFEAENYTLEWIGNMAGKRESRRMKTAYSLTGADIMNGRSFEDAGFYGGWYIDSHPPGGMKDSGSENCVQKPVHVYQIPLRCLYGGPANLFVSGRIIGTDNEAFFSSRVMNTCALSGQAAGTLAAYCIHRGIKTADIGKTDTAAVRVLLQREDMFLPGVGSRDPGDAAGQAELKVSSTSDALPGSVSGELSLEQGGFAVFPGKHGKIRICLRSREVATLNAVCSASSLPNRYLSGKTAESFSWKLKPGENNILMTVPEIVENRFGMLLFEPAGGVSLTCCKKERIGFICGETDSSDYREPRIFYETEAASDLYAAENLRNGFTRPWNCPNVWIPDRDDRKPWITLSFAKPERLREIRLFLEPDLSMELVNCSTAHWDENHRYTRRYSMPEQLAKDILVTAVTEDGEKRTLFRTENNCRRMLVLPVETDKRLACFKVELSRSWGNAQPAVYEILALRAGK